LGTTTLSFRTISIDAFRLLATLCRHYFPAVAERGLSALKTCAERSGPRSQLLIGTIECWGPSPWSCPIYRRRVSRGLALEYWLQAMFPHLSRSVRKRTIQVLAASEIPKEISVLVTPQSDKPRRCKAKNENNDRSVCRIVKQPSGHG